jgi:hypothetical protein
VFQCLLSVLRCSCGDCHKLGEGEGGSGPPMTCSKLPHSDLWRVRYRRIREEGVVFLATPSHCA